MRHSPDLRAVAASPWTDEAAWKNTRKPIHAASALPADCYAGEDFFAAEQEQVFRSAWVCVGTVGELDDPDTMLVREVGGESILLLRNADGELRSFRNACRHRGTELADGDCTVGTTIRCPYHRWGYSRDGALIATPRFAEAGVDDFDPDEFGLHAVRVESWGPMLWVTLSNDTMPLAEWIGDLDDRLRGYRIAEWTERERRTVPINSNWKLISENFQEYYHLTWVHPELAKVSRVEDHYRFQGPGMYCGQTTTPVSGDDRNDWLTMPAAEGLSDTDAQSSRFLAMFPNVLVSVLPNHILLMILHPVSAGVTEEQLVFLLPPAGADCTEEAFAVTRDFWVEVNDEDIDIVERGQRGLSRGGYTPGRLSPRFEEPLHRFHNMLADHMVGNVRVPGGDPSDATSILGGGENPIPWSPATG